MMKSEANEFTETFSCEDTCAIFRGQKYYFNCCQTHSDENGDITKVTAEVYTLPQSETVFFTGKASASECVEAFLIPRSLTAGNFMMSMTNFKSRTNGHKMAVIRKY